MARRGGGAGISGASDFGAASTFGAPLSFFGADFCCAWAACGLRSALSCLGLSSFAILSVHLLAVVLEHAHLAAVLERLGADAVALLRRRIEEGDVGNMDRQVLVHDAAGHALHRVRTLVLLDAVHAFHHDVGVIHPAQHHAPLALVAAREHDHLVAFLDARHHSTSGASDTIFMKRSVRSSRVTGPKMRVPIGSSFGVSSTAALPSNLIRLPSARRTPFAVRTTTAW